MHNMRNEIHHADPRMSTKTRAVLQIPPTILLENKHAMIKTEKQLKAIKE